MNSVHLRGHNFVCVLVGCKFRLAVDDSLELDAGDRLVDCLEGDTEGSLRHAGLWVPGGAEQVALGEVDRDTLRHRILGSGTEDSVFRLKKIHDDLEVGGVVTRIGEDQNGVDLDLAEIPRVRSGALLRSEELLQGGDSRLCSYVSFGTMMFLKPYCLATSRHR